jgi:hypothetical protein
VCFNLLRTNEKKAIRARILMNQDSLSRQNEKVIRGGGMIEIASVEALYDHLSLVAEVLQDPDRFLINSMGIIVLGEGAIVHVGELAGHLPVIEEIIYIHLVYVATCI